MYMIMYVKCRIVRRNACEECLLSKCYQKAVTRTASPRSGKYSPLTDRFDLI